MRRIMLVTLLGLSSCQWIGNTADNLGEHMPVIGERCEHWQCITTEGQARSDENKKLMAQEKARQAALPPQPPPEPPPSGAFPAQPSRATLP